MSELTPNALHAELRALIASSRQRLAHKFGRGFEAKNLRRMLQFAVAFPNPENVASLMRHLSWTHFLQFLPLKAEAARWFYALQCVESRWSVRELRHQIERKAFKRTDLAALQTHAPVQAELVVAARANPAPAFKTRTCLTDNRDFSPRSCSFSALSFQSLLKILENWIVLP